MSARSYRKTLYESPQGRWSMKGLRMPSIAEPAVPIACCGTDHGMWQCLEFYLRDSNATVAPLIASDIIANSYVRMTYPTSLTTTATMGTSLVASISFRTDDDVLHYLPSIQHAALSMQNDHPQITVFGTFGDYANITSTRTYFLQEFQPPVCAVRVAIDVKQDIQLSSRLHASDAFRFLTISSMFTESQYDANALQYCDSEGLKNLRQLDSSSPRGHRIFTRSLPASKQIALLKDNNSTGKQNEPGSPDSPSLLASFKPTSYETGVQMYLDRSTNVNDDSLNAWLEWRDVPQLLREGANIVFEYEATVEAPRAFDEG